MYLKSPYIQHDTVPQLCEIEVIFFENFESASRTEADIQSTAVYCCYPLILSVIYEVQLLTDVLNVRKRSQS